MLKVRWPWLPSPVHPHPKVRQIYRNIRTKKFIAINVAFAVMGTGHWVHACMAAALILNLSLGLFCIFHFETGSH